MSGLPSKADIAGCYGHVRFVPEADIRLFDHLVRGREQARRHGEAEHPGRLSADDQLELGRLNHRQFRRLGTLEDAADISADLAKRVAKVGSIAHKPADVGKLTM